MVTKTNSRMVEAVVSAVNIKDFGAVGDGVTDDTDALINALSSGRNIVLPPDKNYLITRTVTIPSNTTIEMTDATISAKKGLLTEGTGNSLLVLSDNLHVIGGTIDFGLGSEDLGRYPNEESTGSKEDNGLTSPIDGMRSTSVKDVKFSGVTFQNSIYTMYKDYGSLPDSPAEYIVFDGCTFDNILGNVIELQGVKNARITNNACKYTGDIRSHTRGSFILAVADNCVFSDNVVKHTTDSTFYINGKGAGHTVCSGNTIDYGGKDVIKFINSASNGTISNNHIKVAGKTPIGVFDDGTTDYGSVSVTGNSIGYMETPVILDQYSKYTTPLNITGSNGQNKKWYANGTGAVGIGVSAANCAVSSNTLVATLSAGISISEQSCVIANNAIKNCAGAAIYNTAANTVITGNALEDVGNDSSNAQSNIVDAIFLAGSSLSVTGNTVDGAGGSGVAVNINSSSIIVADNIIKDVVGNGVLANGVVGVIRDITIKGNTMLSIQGRGCWFRNVYSAAIADNNITSTGDGVRAHDGSKDVTVSGNVVDAGSDAIYLQEIAGYSIVGNRVKSASRGIVASSLSSLGSVIGNSSSATTPYVQGDGTTKPAVWADYNA